MARDPAETPPPGIRPEVWAAYLDAPEHMVAEILGGELFLMPRPICFAPAWPSSPTIALRRTT
jgi:hypothetical protein